MTTEATRLQTDNAARIDGKPLSRDVAPAKPSDPPRDRGRTPKPRNDTVSRDIETATRWAELEAVRETRVNPEKTRVLNAMTPKNGPWILRELKSVAKTFEILDEREISLVLLLALELPFSAFLDIDAFRGELAATLRKDARDGGLLGQRAEFASILIADIAGGVQISRQKLLDFAERFYRLGVDGGDTRAETAGKEVAQ